MEKKAMLVTFTFTTRVVVPAEYNDEKTASLAATHLKKRIEKDNTLEFNNAFTSCVNDTEVPFDPEKDVRPAPGVFN
jgi:hypothetical protein